MYPVPVFSPAVVTMLGLSRAMRLEERIARLYGEMERVPDRASSITHLPIALKSTDPASAAEELNQQLLALDPKGSFFTATGERENGTRLGYASDLFQASRTATPNDLIRFLMFDLYTRVRSWWILHVWRAGDLANAAGEALSEWEILPAAACARALLEGVAAFVIEGEQLFSEWSRFKAVGLPTWASIVAFRGQLADRLLRIEYGSRVGERSGNPASPLKSLNVMTVLEKFAKRVGDEVEFWTMYEWLCDAVHPSFGFGTAFVATRGRHPSGITLAVDFARRTHLANTNLAKIDATVAFAAADAIVLSVDELLTELSRARWLVADIGLTSGAMFSSNDFSVGTTKTPERNGRCPCGSGRKFKACTHQWGTPADPPELRSVVRDEESNV